MPTKKPVIQAVVNQETYDKLKKEADRTGLSVSKLTSMILNNYVNIEQKEKFKILFDFDE